jgi:multiple sugar transport system substrate-binding protein
MLREFGDPAAGRYGFAPALGKGAQGIYRDIFPWIWVSGASMVQDGALRFNTPAVVQGLRFLEGLSRENLIPPDLFVKSEAARLQDFIDGRLAMMIGSMQDARMLREAGVSFSVTALPAPRAYIGKPVFGLLSWCAGLSSAGDHKEEAGVFLNFLLERADVLAEGLSILAETAGTKIAARSEEDPLQAKAAAIYEAGEAPAETAFIPRAAALEGILEEELPRMFAGLQSAEDTAAVVQARWEASASPPVSPPTKPPASTP